MTRAVARRIELASPSDVTALERLFDAGEIAPAEVVAVLAKTEGNGGRNDFSRELAVRALADALARRLGLSREEVEERVVLSVSGGCEGIASPHAVVFGQRGAAAPRPAGDKRLALAVGHTRAFTPDEIGREAQVAETSRAVSEIVARLGVAAEDVHLVQIKGAIPRDDRGTSARCDMVHSRAASALGVAIALGEVDACRVTDAVIAHDFSLFSSVASVSSKPGLPRSEVTVLANAATWDGDLAIAHGALEDPIDAGGVRRVLERLGLRDGDGDRVVGAFAKAEAPASRRVRGLRHVMLDDDDVDDTRWARASVAAVVASVVGHTAVYVSTRAEHMGPPGGGPIAIVARVGERGGHA